MVNSVQSYLDQQFPDAWYSEVLYVQNGGTATAGQNHNEDGATMILITGIIVTSTDLGVLATLTDQFGRLVIAIHANGNSTGFYPTFLILRAESFRINSTVVNANFRFTVQYQYLRWTDVKKKANKE